MDLFFFFFFFFSLQINALLAHYGYESIAFSRLEEETWYNQEKFQTWIEDVRRATDPLHSASSSLTETPVMRTILLGLDGRHRRRNFLDTLTLTSTNPLTVTIPPSTCASTLTTPSTFPSWSALLPYYNMMFPGLSSYSLTNPTTSLNPSSGSSSTHTHSLPISTIVPNPSDCPPMSSFSVISSPSQTQRYSPLDPHRHHPASLNRARSRSPSRESQPESDLVSPFLFYSIIAKEKKNLAATIIIENPLLHLSPSLK